MAKKKFKLSMEPAAFRIKARDLILEADEAGEPKNSNQEIAAAFGHAEGKESVMWLRQKIDGLRKKFVARFTEVKDREPTEEEVDNWLPRLNDERGQNGGRRAADNSWMDDDIDQLLAAGVSGIDPDLVDGFVKL